MNSEKESVFLSMEQVCVTLDASPSSRNFIEGEAILKSRQLILCEASKRTEFKVHVYALCLQTLALDSPPHTVEAVLKINRKKYASVVSISCSYKAGEGSRCKHVAATLLHCNRLYFGLITLQ
jgi:hypothetical protein